MIGSNIKKLRIQQGLTQKNLADKLFVSAQAVSRWENNEVEPSISTIIELAKIFGVSADEIMGIESENGATEPQTQKEPEKEYVYKEPPRQFLAVCHKCNKPIYESFNIVRKDDKVLCKSCDTKEKEYIRRGKIEKSVKRRTRSFIFGPLVAILWLILWGSGNGFSTFDSGITGAVISIGLFTFTSCCILGNNFIGDITMTIGSWGFVRMPGLIFSLDLDGCLWFLTVKLALFLISLALGLAFTLLAVIIGGFFSLFVYPFAIVKNFRNPEDIDEI